MRVLLLCLVAVLPAFGAGELSGRRAPGFSLPDLNLKQYDVADYRGKVVLIDIMQTNCPHCQTFSRTLEKVKQRYGDKVMILSVVNPPDTQATVRSYILSHGVTVPVLFDCGQMAASYLKITPQRPSISVPHLFIIDANGWIRNDYPYGDAHKAIFEGAGLFAELDRLLGAAPAKPQ
ncbi:MAG: TlpA disulfide reductase family protein [Acidobacteriota bacterium]